MWRPEICLINEEMLEELKSVYNVEAAFGNAWNRTISEKKIDVMVGKVTI